MSPSDRLRLFVAVSVPTALLARLEEETSPLRERWPNGRWAAPANQHVTLKFLGWVEERALPSVAEVVAACATEHAPTRLALEGLGVFPTPSRARVLWVGLVDPDDVLRSLAGCLEARFEPLGFESERRPFRAHLTLARFKQPVRAGRDLPALDLGEETSFTAETVELFRSHLSPKGARYEVLGSFPLGGRAY